MVQNTKLNLKDSSEEKIVKEFIAFIEKIPIITKCESSILKNVIKNEKDNKICV